MNNSVEVTSVLKKLIAAACTAISFIFGDMDGMFIALIALIVLDYISGVLVAIVKKKLSSEVGAKGIAKKIIMLLIVAVANIVDIDVIGNGHILKTITVTFYIVNECISLMENAAQLGVPLPKKLLDVLEQLKKDGSEGKLKKADKDESEKKE